MKLEKQHVKNVLDKAGITYLSLEEESKLGIVVRMEPEQIIPALMEARDGELACEQLIDCFGADLSELEQEEGEAPLEKPIEVTYHLRSMANDWDFYYKTSYPFDGVYHSVIDVYRCVLLSERELCEMFGLYLEDHPNPKRMLTTPTFLTPLRKSVHLRTKEEIWSKY